MAVTSKDVKIAALTGILIAIASLVITQAAKKG